MPQFDYITCWNQISWNFLIFLIFYFYSVKNHLPNFSSSIKIRQKLRLLINPIYNKIFNKTINDSYSFVINNSIIDYFSNFSAQSFKHILFFVDWTNLKKTKYINCINL